MTDKDTLLREFEAWLNEEYESSGDGDYNEAILAGLTKLEELKKKYGTKERQ